MSNISDINQAISSSYHSTISTNNDNISLEYNDINRGINNIEFNIFGSTEEKEKLNEYYDNFYN